MAYLNHDSKEERVHNLGINSGYFAALMIFASVLYFILNFLNKIPETTKYHHVLILAAIIYMARFAALKLKK